MECVKGFKDVSGQEAIKQEKIRQIVAETFALYGFEPAETPIIEDEVFVKGDNASDEAVSDIFKLKDRGGRKLALRYEFTFQLKRLAKNKKLPYKRFQIGPVFRDEPVSANRFRQFTQSDIDVVGSDVRDEAEVLKIFDKIFKKIGIKNIIYINNRKLVNEILDAEGVKKKEEVIREIDKLDKLAEKEIKVDKKILAIFKKPENYFKKYKSYSEILELKKACKDFGVNVVFQPSLARGLSYYNGSVFEIKSRIKESIAGGGSYLVGDVQATGISLSIERLSSLAKISDDSKRVVVISIKKDKEAIKVAESLRDSGIVCSLMFGKIRKAMEYANSNKFDYAVFIGEKEVEAKKFTLRDLDSGKEVKKDVKELAKVLK